MILCERSTTRSIWYYQRLNDFISDDTTSTLYLELYSSEVKKIRRDFPDVTVTVGDKLPSDNRHICVIEKNA